MHYPRFFDLIGGSNPGHSDVAKETASKKKCHQPYISGIKTALAIQMDIRHVEGGDNNTFDISVTTEVLIVI